MQRMKHEKPHEYALYLARNALLFGGPLTLDTELCQASCTPSGLQELCARMMQQPPIHICLEAP